MASRKFKQDWIPGPFSAHIALPETQSPGSPSRPLTSSPQQQQPESALASAASLSAARAAAAGTALASAATSALATARSSTAGAAFVSVANTALTSAKAAASAAGGSAIASAASSALATARASAAAARAAGGSAIASAASSALATARASAAAAVLASVLEPVPSPVALINRASYIIKYLLKSTFREIFRVVISAIRGKRERSIEAAQEAREFAERLGGMWVILVRLASLRGDLLGVEFCRELARTRDLSTATPFAQIRKVIEEDLRTVGTSFEETFLEFDEVPLNVRSFGQVHRARLQKNKREVLVRVRSPDAPQRAKTDWRYLRIVLFFIEQLDLEPHLRWDDLMFEVKKSTEDLLDFRSEVEELKRIRKVLRKRRIYVPMIFQRYCTERVLVQEYIHGISVADLVQATHLNPRLGDDWMRENKIDPRRIWSRLFKVHHELLFEHNLFYTELSPSSILLLKGNRLAFVSFGSVGTLDADLQRRYRTLYRAFLTADYTKACDYYLTLGPALPYKDITNMKQQSLRLLRKWESRTHIKNCPYSEKSLGSAVGQLAHCASAQQLPTFWNLARLQLSEQILNSSLEFFDPTKSSLKALRRYEQSAQIRSIKNALTRNVRKRINTATDVAQLNLQLLENFENDGEYLRNRLAGVQAKLSKISAIAGRLVGLLSKVAILAIVLQVFLFFKQGYHVSVPLADQGTLGKILSTIRPRTTASWVVLFAILFYFRRFLTKLTQQLFTKSLGPGDVT